MEEGVAVRASGSVSPTLSVALQLRKQGLIGRQTGEQVSGKIMGWACHFLVR